jgi:hypothetical protein
MVSDTKRGQARGKRCLAPGGARREEDGVWHHNKRGVRGAGGQTLLGFVNKKIECYAVIMAQRTIKILKSYIILYRVCNY